MLERSLCHVLTCSFKCAGVEIHSFRSHIKDHIVLEWKSTLKIVESTLKRVLQSTILWSGFHYNLGVDSTPNEDLVIPNNITPNMPKRVDFHSTELRECACHVDPVIATRYSHVPLYFSRKFAIFITFELL